MTDDDAHSVESPRPTIEGAVLISLPADIDDRTRGRITWILGGLLRRSVEVHTYRSESTVEYCPPRENVFSAIRRVWDAYRRF